jgi:hypothetical protein
MWLAMCFERKKDYFPLYFGMIKLPASLVGCGSSFDFSPIIFYTYDNENVRNTKIKNYCIFITFHEMMKTNSIPFG